MNPQTPENSISKKCFIKNELSEILSQEGIRNFSEAERFLTNQLRLLQKNGSLSLGDDKDLSAVPLEVRVLRLFESVEFDIKPGREGKEDFVITAKEDDIPKDNLVVEVKSGENRPIDLKDLRQLDDWVFDLSGKEQARKHGLSVGFQIVPWGLGSSPRHHPTPHKGVMIFNGPVGTPFSDRSNSILHPNQRDFAHKRNFCVIGLEDLIGLIDQDRESLWTTLHSTVGEYSRGKLE